jgi:predicted phosphodiesterase
LKIATYEFPESWAELELFPVSCIHIGDANTDIAAFRNFVNMIGKKENRFVVFLGDGINNALKTSVSNVYNEVMSPNEQRKFLAEELLPIKERILYMIDGNHEYRSKKDVDMSPIEWLAETLGCKHYNGNEGAMKISLGKSLSEGKRLSYGIYFIHGHGGGKRPGGALNNLELTAMSIGNADVVIMGHVHKSMGYRFCTREMDLHNNTIKMVEKVCVVAPAWQNYGGYAARMMMIPGAKVCEPIILSGKEKKARAII